MAVTAAAGIVGFAPQNYKSDHVSYTAPGNGDFYRHKATQVDLAIMDDTRLGDDEVGGRPVPTFPYKAGVVVGGGMTIQPRLEDSFGWLLYGAMGKAVTTPSGVDGGILTSGSLNGSPKNYTTGSGVVSPPAPAKVYGKVLATSGSSLSGNVVITGTDADDAVLTETLVFSSNIVGTTVRATTRVPFKTVTNVALPAAATGDVVSIGYDASIAHVFTMDTASPGFVPWMSFRKYIPPSGTDITTDLGEVYTDCKIVGAAFTLAADRPITSRVDILGRSFVLDHSPNAWTWANEFEDFESIPIGTATAGYIKVAGNELPVVQATVTWQNAPLDTRMERVYGDPFLEDITIVRRQLAFDLLVKWNNPDLYSQVLTGNTSGSAWICQPFTAALDLNMATCEKIVDTDTFGLRVQCTSAMLALNGGITLAGGQAVMMRFSGVALDTPDGDYATITLTNGATGYVWPS